MGKYRKFCGMKNGWYSHREIIRMFSSIWNNDDDDDDDNEFTDSLWSLVDQLLVIL
jgi:hypothetical protein